jgi:hypothetical protein
MMRIPVPLALALLLAGCAHAAGSGPATAAATHCHADFPPPGTGITVGASITGTVWTRCDIPPAAHVLTMRLQRQVNATWVDQATPEVIGGTIPLPIQVVNVIAAPCVPGWWRVEAHTVGVSVSGEKFAVGLTGKPVEVHCG